VGRLPRGKAHTAPAGRTVRAMTTPLVDGDRPTSTKQDAVRLLLLIHTAADPVPSPPPGEAPRDAVAVLRTQVLLQKLDFWLRNPDYLANELLTRYEHDGDPQDLDLAEQILASDEPEVRRYPMLRYLFGAYEPLDDALAMLASPRLVLKRRTRHGARPPLDYYLTEKGQAVALQIVASVPELAYYVDRSRLVADLAGGRRGSALRDVQYLQQEYADTALGERIGGIAARARQRLADLHAATAQGST
jgi:hypothetical protein